MAKAFNLKNGTILLSTEAPGGLYNAAQLKKIAEISDSNMAIVKATEDQRLALFVKEEDAAKITAELKNIGLGIRHYQDGLHQPTACIGELCPDHEQDALGSAMDLTKELADIKLSSPLKIGINGCASCCVPCHTLDIAILGDSRGYRISLGGKNSQIPEMASFMAEGVPAEKLTGLIKQVVSLYQTMAEPGESLQDLMERAGAGEFIKALAPYSQDAAGGEVDPFGATEPEGQNLGLGDELDSLQGADETDLDDSLNGDVALDDIEMDASDPELADLEESPVVAANDADADLSSDRDLVMDDVISEEPLTMNDEDVSLEDDSLPSQDVGTLSLGVDDMLMEDAVLDEDLSIEELAEAPPMAASAQPPATHSPPLEDDVEDLSEEAESDFEDQLAESIAEEETIRAQEEPDENLTTRDETLDFLEEKLTMNADLDSEPELMEESLAPNLADAPLIRSSMEGRAAQALVSVEVADNGYLVLEFESGAFVQLDPQKVPASGKILKFGGQTLQIAVNAAGFQVEADGVGFFYPFSQFQAA